MDIALLTRPRLDEDGEFQSGGVANMVTRRDYERCFQAPRKPGAVRFGEASSCLPFYPEAARRIAEQIPEGKIVVVLRDPVERTLAHYALFERQGPRNTAASRTRWSRRSGGWLRVGPTIGRISGCRSTRSRCDAISRSSRCRKFIWCGRRAWRVRRCARQRGATCWSSWASTRRFPHQRSEGSALPPIPTAGECRSARGVMCHRGSRRRASFIRRCFQRRRSARRRCGGWQATAARRGAPAGRMAHSADAAPGAKGAVFQHLLFTRDLTREALYCRKVSHNPTAHPRLSMAGGMNFLKDEIISFDGYFNAFFESLVAEHTGMRSIQLRLDFTGHFFVEVLRFAQGRAAQLRRQRAERRRTRDGPLAIDWTLTTDSPLGSRLAFHLTCLSKTGRSPQAAGGRRPRRAGRAARHPLLHIQEARVHRTHRAPGRRLPPARTRELPYNCRRQWVGPAG